MGVGTLFSMQVGRQYSLYGIRWIQPCDGLRESRRALTCIHGHHLRQCLHGQLSCNGAFSSDSILIVRILSACCSCLHSSSLTQICNSARASRRVPELVIDSAWRAAEPKRTFSAGCTHHSTRRARLCHAMVRRSLAFRRGSVRQWWIARFGQALTSPRRPTTQTAHTDAPNPSFHECLVDSCM